MPPSTRIVALEFRSLLLPPIRVPLRAIRPLCRPQCIPAILHAVDPPQCLAHRRSLHLYKTARAKTVLGMHKVVSFSPYEIAEPTASEHRVNLVRSDTDPTIVAEDISLQELYDTHVKPGDLLYLTQPVEKKTAENTKKLIDEDVPKDVRNYAIVKANTHSVPLKPGTKGKQLGGLKVIIINLSNPVFYFKLALDRAYQFIANGSPVELRIRMRGAKTKPVEKMKPGDADDWPWMHKHFPHIRPDFILKEMPEGTFYLIKPVSDGRILQFVMAKAAEQMPLVNLDARLLRVKNAVEQSIEQGKQGQLPKVIRSELQAAGHKDYSVRSGMPRHLAVAKYGRMKEKKWEDIWGSEEAEGRKTAVPDDEYIVPLGKDKESDLGQTPEK